MNLRHPPVCTLALATLGASSPPAHAASNASKAETVAMVKMGVAMVEAKPAGAWQEYKVTNPVTNEIKPKVMYCEELDNTAVCGGVYP